MKQLQPGPEPSLYLQIFQQTQQLMESFFNFCLVKNNKTSDTFWQDVFGVGHVFQYWWQEVFSEPNKILAAQIRWYEEFMLLGQSFQQKLMNTQSHASGVAKKKDKRFLGAAWQAEPFYDFLAEAYLLLVQHCMDFIAQNPSANPKINQQITFFTRQYLDALAPSNFPYTNPEIIQETCSRNGSNFIKGINNFVMDWQKNGGYLNIQMTDMSAFEIGKDIAITPGKIIFQNHLLQLIQYSPVTSQTHARPILFIPPCINKYYILDLTAKKSLVKWVVEQGLTVFMISWVNPDKSHQDINFEDYVCEGVITAIDQIQKVTGTESINALGFCIGGTILATTLGYMQAKGDKRINSATFLATLIDFSQAGDLSVFIDEPQLQALEARMDHLGYLDGRLLQMIFNLLRANELFWPYFINHYLKGHTPSAFDLLFWNCDPVNLPKKMASFYLRNMYLENNLIKKSHLTIQEIKIDLSTVTQPCYFLATEMDHIAPWQASFQGTQILQGENTFVLAGSGHIAGIINPPVNNKYGYRVAKHPSQRESCHSQWYENASVREGSWWTHWMEWLKPLSGELMAAKKTSGEQNAPGEYIQKRL